MVSSDKRTIATHGGDFAHLGHSGQATGQFADHFFFVTAQFVDVEFGLAEIHTQIRHVADFVHHRSHVQERFGWNTSHVQAHATQGSVSLNNDNAQAKVCGSESGGVTAGATAQD